MPLTVQWAPGVPGHSAARRAVQEAFDLGLAGSRSHQPTAVHRAHLRSKRACPVLLSTHAHAQWTVRCRRGIAANPARVHAARGHKCAAALCWGSRHTEGRRARLPWLAIAHVRTVPALVTVSCQTGLPGGHAANHVVTQVCAPARAGSQKQQRTVANLVHPSRASSLVMRGPARSHVPYPTGVHGACVRAHAVKV